MRIAVLAGTVEEFRQYKFELGDQNVNQVFYATERSLRGCKIQGYVITGTFNERRDSQKILALAKISLAAR